MSSLKRKKSASDEQVEMRKAQKQAWVQSIIRQQLEGKGTWNNFEL